MTTSEEKCQQMIIGDDRRDKSFSTESPRDSFKADESTNSESGGDGDGWE